MTTARPMLGSVVALAMACLLAAACPASAQDSLGQPANTPPDETSFIFRRVPDITITPIEGSPVTLSALGRSSPLVITFIYTRCGGVCSPFLESLAAAARQTGGLGSAYRILVLSFDSRDTLADLRAAARAHGLAADQGWIFGAASSPDIARLARATGFWFAWHWSSGQYDHPSLLIAVDQGRIVRMLAGATIPPSRFREITDELRGKFVPSYPAQNRRVAFRCFRYTPGGGIQIGWGFLVLLAPGALAISSALWIFARSRGSAS